MTTPIKVPPQLSMNRDPHWVSVPREVGDGMEAESQQSATSIFPATSSASSASIISSITGSRSPSPHSLFHVVDEHQRSSPFPDIVALPSVTSLAQSSVSLSNSEKFLIEEKAALKDHLEVQIQVNQEIKKLLVASVGDDLGFHYERLSAEKSQLTKEIEDLKARLAAKKEELERLEISCDIWRSKFLASRLQCDDLVEWKRIHERQMRELESGARGLLREHWDRTEHLQHTYESLCLLDAALNDRSCAQANDGLSSVAEKCRRTANALTHTLLDAKDIPPFTRLHYTPSPTPAEKYVLQILGDLQRSPSTASDKEATSKQLKEVRLSRGVLSHLHTYPGSLTLNCCKRCKGDIFVV